MKRVLTAALLIPFVVYIVLWANPWVFLSVVALSAVLSYREYDCIAASYGFGAPGLLGYVGLLLLTPGRLLAPYHELWLVAVAFVLLALVLAMRSAELPHALPRTSLLVLGVIYIFGCWR